MLRILGWLHGIRAFYARALSHTAPGEPIRIFWTRSASDRLIRMLPATFRPGKGHLVTLRALMGSFQFVQLLFAVGCGRRQKAVQADGIDRIIFVPPVGKSEWNDARGWHFRLRTTRDLP
jgi:hypothetical protein